MKQFYKAISQFRRKHFNRGLPALLNAGMEVAIWLRAGVGAIGRGGRAVSPVTQDPVILKTQLMGDPATILRLREFFTTSGIRIVAGDSRQAEEIILCEGAQFSFKDCIRSLEAAAPYRTGLPVKFYAKGSGSVVGSAHRDGRGEIIEAVPHR